MGSGIQATEEGALRVGVVEDRMRAAATQRANTSADNVLPKIPIHFELPVVRGTGESTFTSRPSVVGKFIYVDGEKFYIKGVTYGAFRPDLHKQEYNNTVQIEKDFALMAANGINTVRIPHAVPPRSLLDIAIQHGLRVMVGLSAEQYIGYLIDTAKKAPDVEAAVREKVRTVKDHPALLCDWQRDHSLGGALARI